MDESPPKTEAPVPRARKLEPLEATEIGLTISTSTGVGKPRRPFVHQWSAARLNFLSAECARLKAGPVACFFLKQAKQHALHCDPRRRFRVWNYLDIVADQLARSSRPSQKLLKEDQ
jgi:hypothetical protein